MSWSTAHRWLALVSRPLRRLVSMYALLLALFVLLRLLRLSGIPLLDLANTFAPYLFMPLVITFPLPILIMRATAEPTERARKRLSSPRKFSASAAPRPRPRWCALLQLALIVIGLYWFALPALYRPVAPPQGETFRVVTFNVQGSNHDLGRAMNWLLEQAPDIILLQETAEGYDSRLAPLYDAYAYEDHVESGARIFSRYAILQRTVIVLEDEPGRLALRLLLDQNGRELAVYAVHMTLPLRPRENDAVGEDIGPEALLRYDEARRNAQIRQLLTRLREESAPTIVAGDFNMSDTSLIYAELAGQLRDAWREAGTGAGRTWPLAEAIALPRIIRPLLRIDYIWHSDALRPTHAAVGAPIGSDHLPFFAEFEWAGG
ncbi:MAG: endonuclease/exonuclease/phosphatase family protein [Chloroflexi bacterium]|nr:endonuclease/exonuclease/phosphatase family protein [Chloroflexota bacterium]MCY4247095.1 endonuclease/exonuclease/phosphatase family protein [Chloroflexota bacterium]